MASLLPPSTASSSNADAMQMVSDANYLFAANLHEKLKPENPTRNLIYAPFGLCTVIAMLQLGARGKTLEEIEMATKLPSDPKQMSAGFSNLLASFKTSDDAYTLTAANGLYIQKGFEVKKEFSEILKNSFGETQQLDFNNAWAAAKEINLWVEKTTMDQIKNFISPDAFNDRTRLVLVNGVYFKGLWKKQFDRTRTRPMRFNLNGIVSVPDVPMMFINGDILYAKFDQMDAQAVTLPYKGDRLAMIVYVPDRLNGMSKIEAGLKDLKLSEVLTKFVQKEMELLMPRFTLESKLQLVEPLKKMGMQSMFDESADFSGISEKPGLNVSKIVQNVVIAVNEEGSEAAAATATSGMLGSHRMQFRLTVNRPFYFQIVDLQTSNLLFAGVCQTPKV